jgi:type II secretory pathway component HofQ
MFLQVRQYIHSVNGVNVLMFLQVRQYIHSVNGVNVLMFLQVRQYIHSVNGVNVLRNNHKEVARKIMDIEQYLNLFVMVHKRDAEFNDIELY